MSRAPMDEATLARRAATLREWSRRESPLAGVRWPSGVEERAPTWLDRAATGLALGVAAAFVAALALGLAAPDGCPPADAIFGDAHACDAYVKDEAYWNARLGVPPSNNDKE